MSLSKHPIDYIEKAVDREKRTLAMSTEHDIAFGISVLDHPERKRNMHLWCYSTIALDKVEEWLKSIQAISTPNIESFKNFEDLYGFVNRGIGGIKGIGNVEVYDVALYLGERMNPQVVPMANVYVHGKLVEAAVHYLTLTGRKVPKSLHAIKVEEFGVLYTEIADSPYAARAIEEWLCSEHDEIMKL